MDVEVDAATKISVLDALLRQRHSCRGFRADPLPPDLIQSIANMAQRAASWCNVQPWQLFVTSGAATQKFREVLMAAAVQELKGEGLPIRPDIAFPDRYEGVYLDRRRDCGFHLYESVGVARGDRKASARQAMENYSFFGAPHVAVITTPKALGTYGAVDCGGFVATFMLVAQAHGVASIAQASIARFAPTVRDHFDIPLEQNVLCGISFGYEDEGHPANAFRTTRAEWSDTVKFTED